MEKNYKSLAVLLNAPTNQIVAKHKYLRRRGGAKAPPRKER